MSGHSKWAQIKRQKGVADVKRGAAFTKMANAITISVREGGGVSDPAQNFRLRLTIEKARTINMPKENIQRAIDRAKAKGGEGFVQTIYEGFTPGGAAFIIEAATDNKLRTNSEIKNIIEKSGGTMGNPGTVSYMFEQKGMITVVKNGQTVDDIFLLAADAGAEDVEEAGDSVLVYTKPTDVAKVKDALVANGLSVSEFELTRKPSTTVPIADKQMAEKILSFMDKIEEPDDVQKVYSNFDIPDNLLQ